MLHVFLRNSRDKITIIIIIIIIIIIKKKSVP